MMDSRRKLQFKEEDDADIQLEPKRVQKASTIKDKALLTAAEVSNNLVQDRAVMETKVEFKG